MLGKKPEQLWDGVVKTSTDLYAALGCNRDNFANNILAHKMSVSFNPDDNNRLSYETIVSHQPHSMQNRNLT